MPKYCNATRVLPKELVRALQEHAPGLCIYVPKPDRRAAWGSKSGSRVELDVRNATIRERRQSGATVPELAEEFHLSEASIRKILRGKNSSKSSGA